MSDGAPIDDGTYSQNGGNYLERHLHAVIGAIEEACIVHSAALGVDHTLSDYHRHSAVWRAEEGQDGISLAWRLVIGDV